MIVQSASGNKCGYGRCDKSAAVWCKADCKQGDREVSSCRANRMPPTKWVALGGLMNAPDRFELFVLPDGVKKVTVVADTKMANTSTFTIQKEDHTLGYALCRRMQAQPNVIYAGYKVPHPLEHSFVLKLQTDRNSTPVETMQQGIDGLIGDLSLLEERVKNEIRRVSGLSSSSTKRAW